MKEKFSKVDHYLGKQQFDLFSLFLRALLSKINKNKILKIKTFLHCNFKLFQAPFNLYTFDQNRKT